MGIVVSTNFDYKGPLPLDERLIFDTKADLDAFDKTALYEGIISYVKEDKKRYEFIPDSTGVLSWQEYQAVEPLDDTEVQEIIDSLS